MPENPTMDQWLQSLDRQAKASGERQTPTLFTIHPTLDRDGALWFVKDRDVAAKTMTLARVSTTGQEVRSLSGDLCASLTFAFWGDQILFYRDPAMGRGLCTTARRFP
jgi:hypothetical protein